MRVLFTAHGGSGHWRPLALAFEAAGHEAAFAMTPEFCRIIARYGFRCFPAGADGGVPTDQPPQEGAPPDPKAEPDQAPFVWATVFAGSRAQRSLPDLLAIGRTWRPDLIVREISELGGCVAAERLGLPHVAVQISAFRPELHRVIAEPLEHLRAAAGLPSEPALPMRCRYGLLALAPPSFQPPRHILPATTHFVRYEPCDRLLDEPRLDWVGQLPRRPTIYATLGTAYHRTPGVFDAILAGLRDGSVNLIATTGEGEQLDPTQIAPNQWVAQYLPASLIFPFCEAVICHGGFNTVMTAIAHGLPLVLIPIAADQPDNAARCAELGIGRIVSPAERTPSVIRAATRAVLQESSYRQRAAQLRNEMRALPGMAQAVALLERLASERRL